MENESPEWLTNHLNGTDLKVVSTAFGVLKLIT
jgi:hypothetical protein